MPEKICPLIFASVKKSTPGVARCRKEECMWYIQYEGQSEKGVCCITKISYSLNEINTTIQSGKLQPK